MWQDAQRFFRTERGKELLSLRPAIKRVVRCSRFHRIQIKSGGYLAITDLDLDDGEFHEDNTGVIHFGFDRTEFGTMIRSAGFDDVQATTACAVPKPVAGKGIREFSIFLITARKR